MNTIAWAIWDTWNDRIVTTHRGRSTWAKKGFAANALENFREHGNYRAEAFDNRFTIRKALVAVLP